MILSISRPHTLIVCSIKIKYVRCIVHFTLPCNLYDEQMTAHNSIYFHTEIIIMNSLFKWICTCFMGFFITRLRIYKKFENEWKVKEKWSHVHHLTLFPRDPKCIANVFFSQISHHFPFSILFEIDCQINFVINISFQPCPANWAWSTRK